jgi:hypothetical protein
MGAGRIAATLRTLDHWPRQQLYREIGRLIDRAVDLTAQKQALREALEEVIADPIGQAAADYARARDALKLAEGGE